MSRWSMMTTATGGSSEEKAFRLSERIRRARPDESLTAKMWLPAGMSDGEISDPQSSMKPNWASQQVDVLVLYVMSLKRVRKVPFGTFGFRP